MESKFAIKTLASVLNSPNIAIHKNNNCKLENVDIIFFLASLFFNTNLTIIDSTKGITMKVNKLRNNSLRPITLELEKNINRYTGNNINCNTRLIGKIDRLNGRLPLLILVNIKYQSVHGVKINITNPMNKSILPPKKQFPRK